MAEDNLKISTVFRVLHDGFCDRVRRRAGHSYAQPDELSPGRIIHERSRVRS
jgi:hypothetical protein